MKVQFRLLAVLACTTAVSLCLAQGGGGRGQRGGGRNNTSIMGLAGRTDVQADIQITDDEKAKLGELRTSMRANRGAGGGGAAGAGGGTPPTAEERAARTAEQEKQVEAIFTPAQVSRLHEIQVQLMGDQAITLPDVQTKLSLSDDQKTQVTKLNDDFRAASASVRAKQRDGSLDRPTATATNQKNLETLKTELHKVLTSAQVDQLKALGGKTFTPAPPAGGGGISA